MNREMPFAVFTSVVMPAITEQIKNSQQGNLMGTTKTKKI